MDSARREREAAYWDSVAMEARLHEGIVADNIYKRQMIVGRLLLSCEWSNEHVLEIGVGQAQAAATLKVVLLGKWHYTGTEMSEIFLTSSRDAYHLNMVRTDVTNLPGRDGEYTRVMCLDSLEHVHPDDREDGYKEIARVTAKGGFLLINMPLAEDQFHDREFDHPFGLDDLHRIEKNGFRMRSFEKYFPRRGNPGTEIRPSAFVVMERV